MSIQSPPESPTLRRHRSGGGGVAAGGARARPKPAAPPPLPPLSPPPSALGGGGAGDRTPNTSSAPRPHTLDCCVRLLVVHCEPSYSLPWSKKRQYQSSSSGFIVAGAPPATTTAGTGKEKSSKRTGPDGATNSAGLPPMPAWIPGHRLIMTNAHCVQDATSVRVQRRDSPDRFLAEIVAVSTDADLALLTVKDDKFWVDAPAVTFVEEVPRLQERVLVAGFPIGGAGLSLSSGVVSRVEVLPYAHSGVELLAVQSDAPINSGNSGGPAFDREGFCIGAAFQSLRADEADGVGYIIPMPIVRRFLGDVKKHGKYTGFAALGVEWQKIESLALRKGLRLPEGPGVLVRRVDPTAPAAGVLKRGDVILALDGVDIASDGTVPFRPGERVAFSYLISQHFCGGEVSLKVLRAPPGALGEDGTDGDGKDSEGSRREKAKPVAPIPLPLPARKPEVLKVRLARPARLVPYHLEQGASPSYYVIGGLAFTPLTAGYLRSEFGRDYESEAPVSLVAALTHGIVKRPGEQVVLLAQVLAHAANVGYEDVCAAPVRSVNGRRIFSLRDLVKETEAAVARGDAFLQFALSHGDVVVLSVADAVKATPEILEAHAIAKDRSADLLVEEEEEEGGDKKARKKEDEGAAAAKPGGKRARKK